MKPKTQPQFEAFCDGVCEVFSTDENGEPDKPKYKAQYANRIVGAKRFFAAASVQIDINAVIRIPQQQNISPTDLIKIKNDFFKIEQIQHLGNTLPPVTDITTSPIQMHWTG